MSLESNSQKTVSSNSVQRFIRPAIFNNMRIAITTILLIAFAATIAFAQSTLPTRDSWHAFWQPGLKLTYRDYKGAATKEVVEMMDKYDFNASASVGIWSILDIPKKKADRYKKFEKVYFAPAFEFATSFARTTDSLEIEKQNIYLDICEIAARFARKKLRSIQDSTKATGTLTIMYMTVKDEMHEMRIKMYNSYFQDVFIDKKPDGFQEWRKFFDNLLSETTQWATTPEECYRLMTQKPIEKGYIEAPYVVGSFKKEK